MAECLFSSTSNPTMMLRRAVLNILLVGEGDALREVWHTTFRALGYQVLSVTLEEATLKNTADFAPDICIGSVSPAHADGLALLSNLRAAHPMAGIIAVANSSQPGDRVRGYNSGADIYLTQPVDVRELVACTLSLAR